MQPLTFAIASHEWEFEQIHTLNYRTFVREIPQHSPNAEGRLVDKFHDDNTYFICLRDKELVGMVAARAKRPLSLEAKLANLDDYLPPHRSLCEVRLLAVEPDARNGRILAGLLRMLSDHLASYAHDIVVISATVRQLKLYRHLGFVAFGPLVGTPEALYQPMYLTAGTFNKRLSWLCGLLGEAYWT
jgi:hypothetical protein